MPLPKHLRAPDPRDRFKTFLERVDDEFTLREFIMRNPYETKEGLKKILKVCAKRKMIERVGDGKFKKLQENDEN